MAGRTSRRVRPLPVAGFLLLTLAGPVAGQVSLPIAGSDRNAWVSTPEGAAWMELAHPERRAERTAIVLDAREEILLEVLERVLFAPPHASDLPGLDAARSALRGAPFEVGLRPSTEPRLNRHETPIAVDEASALVGTIARVLRDRGVDARAGAPNPEHGLPVQVDGGEPRFRILLEQPVGWSLWIDVAVRVEDLESGENRFRGVAQVVRVAEEWRFIGWGPWVYFTAPS